MAELTCKRPRDAEDNKNSVQPCEKLDTKRLRPYDDMVLSLFEEDVDVPSHDLSTFISSLQRELCTDTAAPLSSSSSSSSLPKGVMEEEDEKEKERVMRLLLEASDDELGLPSREEGFGNGAVSCNGLWEMGDADADYHTLVQSELFNDKLM